VTLDPTLTRRAARPLRLRPRLLRALLAAALLALLLGAGWLWLRDSSLVRVRQVEITGATTSRESDIRAALETAARDMTTLHIREDALRAAVRQFPAVADLRVQRDFPHRLTIEVIEHRPVATLSVGGSRLLASGSGLILRGEKADPDLPSVVVKSAPAGERVADRRTLSALAVAAAAPPQLLRRVERIWWGGRGMTIDLREGPDLIFGGRTEPHAKWAAAARVLAEPSAQGAVYLDLRVPRRVAAGGLGPVPQETPEPGATPVPTNPQP
jgi:cell division protein FtsQ